MSLVFFYLHHLLEFKNIKSERFDVAFRVAEPNNVLILKKQNRKGLNRKHHQGNMYRIDVKFNICSRSKFCHVIVEFVLKLSSVKFQISNSKFDLTWVDSVRKHVISRNIFQKIAVVYHCG